MARSYVLHQRNLCFTLFFLLSILPTLTWSRSWFVSPTVKEGSPQDGSETSPWANISIAVKHASSYDVINLLAGTYDGGQGNENICGKDGRNSDGSFIAPSSSCSNKQGLVLTSYPLGATVIIRAQSPANNNARFLTVLDGSFSSISNLTIENFAYMPHISRTYTPSLKDVELMSGGAIYIANCSSSLLLEGIIFKNNSALSGGALGVVRSSMVLVKDSQFYNNSASLRGGAISSDITNLKIVHSRFSRNMALGYSSIFQVDGSGGAIYAILLRSESVDIEDSHFFDNGAIQSGGAVFTASSSLKEDSLRVIRTHFYNNSVSGGGGCPSVATCNLRGGAVFINLASALFQDCTFRNNKAITGSISSAEGTNQYAEGGAVYALENANVGHILNINATVKFYGSLFEQNHADDYGGAIYSVNERVLVNSCNFSRNFAGVEGELFSEIASGGGAIWISGLQSSSSITNSNFHNNVVWGGWGGALYATELLPSLNLEYCQFKDNTAVSSYTFNGQGGAVMLGHNSNTTINTCDFFNNSATTHPNLSPYTLSGAGGAIFVQSASLSTLGTCKFNGNIARTGQFDGGSSGGALLLEHVSSSSIKGAIFENNGAPGFPGFSSYSSSGSGGAIMMKFSAVTVSECAFSANWVTVGGSQLSTGAAIAIFSSFSDSSLTSSSGDDAEPYSTQILVENSQFIKNYALGEVCTVYGPKSGQGGGIAIVGTENPGVELNGNTFVNNIAASPNKNGIISFGGALSVSMSSKVHAFNCSFTQNAALNGVGDDIAMLPGEAEQTAGSNITLQDSYFSAVTPAVTQSLASEVKITGRHLCSQIRNADSKILTVTGDASPRVGHRGRRYLFEDMVIDSEVEDESELDFTLGTEMEQEDAAMEGDGKTLGENQVGLRNGRHLLQSIEMKLMSLNRRLQRMQESYINIDSPSASSLISTTHPTSAHHLRIAYVAELQREISYLASKQQALRRRRLLDQTENQVNEDRHVHSEQRRRLLETFSRAPSMLIGSGAASLTNPHFEDNYNVFVGNLLLLLQPTEGYTIQAPPCAAKIFGNMIQKNLVLAVFKADLTLFATSSSLSPLKSYEGSIVLKELHLINGTLFSGNNVTIVSNSTIVSSTISSITESFENFPEPINKNFRPQINFLGDVHTGLDNDFDGYDVSQYPIVQEIAGSSYIIFDACEVKMFKSFRLTSNLMRQPSLDVEIAVRLKNQALLNMTKDSILKITTGTIFQADSASDVAIYNDGVISLIGYSFSFDTIGDGGSTTSGGNGGNSGDGGGKDIAVLEDNSVFSALTVYGQFLQTPIGSIHITVADFGSNYSMLHLVSNQSFLGTVKLQLAPNTHLSLFNDPNPSNWMLATFKYVATNPLGRATIVSPDGLGFSTQYFLNDSSVPVASYASSIESYAKPVGGGYSNQYPWLEKVVISDMACSQIASYYDSSSLCGYCLMNSSCSYCDNNQCVEAGQCGQVSASELDQCCDAKCTVGHGTCQGTPTTSYYCECNFFYSGGDCQSLSQRALSVIVVVIFIVTFIGISFYYRMYYKGQKTRVIDELRQGLLQGEEGGGGYTSNNTMQVIQSLQQELILKDVFVNYKEIKLEGKIGEGSFGIVFKATFRGAQVAVKQMRSPLFMELTQNDIEEFRKEAYVMSRLRHPNIVLVMGISLVDQEPVLKLPFSESEKSMTGGGESQSDKAGPKKTVCIITEYLEQGSLADILYGPSRLPAEVWTYELILTCALQAARGMLYLHSHTPPICHRDLKSSNLVVDDHWVVKVTDFGMSRIVPEKLQDLDKGLAIHDDDSVDGGAGGSSSGGATLNAPTMKKERSYANVEEAIDYYFERESFGGGGIRS